jgi:predicted transposase YbfD/YdcC
MLYTAQKTVEAIVESDNEYCIALKGNQPTLLRQAQHSAATHPPLSQFVTSLDPSHGRSVERRVRVFAAPAEATEVWAGLAAFAQVERRGKRQGKSFEHQSWCILSQPLPAQRVAELVQGHRGTIENRVHWVKDVVQGEDESLITRPKAATLMALFRAWAMTALRIAGYDSLTKAFRRVGHDIHTLLSFL